MCSMSWRRASAASSPAREGRTASCAKAGNAPNNVQTSKAHPNRLPRRQTEGRTPRLIKITCPRLKNRSAIGGAAALPFPTQIDPGLAHGLEIHNHDDKFVPETINNKTEKSILTLENDTISCSLPEGDTTFIISLVRSSPLDGFTFVNENIAARGELRIAVSNEKLSADSDKWTPVDGAVSFKRKRLFNVSMLGVEAKYVRLTFHVERENDTAAPGRHGIRTIRR